MKNNEIRIVASNKQYRIALYAIFLVLLIIFLAAL